jgi:hypothetical protein
MDGKSKRQSAYWQGLRVLPCFVDLALSDDDDGKPPSNRPHVPNWICVKENCQDGGLSDLTNPPTPEKMAETIDLHTLPTFASLTPNLTPEKMAETIDLHTLPTLHTESLRDAKNSDEMASDCIEEGIGLGESGSKVCKARLTPTSEPADDGCKVSKVCKESDPSPTKKTPREYEVHDRVVVADRDAGIYKDAIGIVAEVWYGRDGQEIRVRFEKPVRGVESAVFTGSQLMWMRPKA